MQTLNKCMSIARDYKRRNMSKISFLRLYEDGDMLNLLMRYVQICDLP